MAIKMLTPMTKVAFYDEIQSRGWTPEMLSQRWGMSKRRVQQIAADEDRPRYYDDAIRSLPMVVGMSNE